MTIEKGARVFVRENGKWENKGDVIDYVYKFDKGEVGLVALVDIRGRNRIETTNNLRVIQPRPA